jgi:hypothetical protein
MNKQVVLDFMAKYPPEEYKFMYQEQYFKSPAEFLSRLEKDDGIDPFLFTYWRTNKYLLDYVESIGGISKLNACGSDFKVIELSEEDSQIFNEDQIAWGVELHCCGEYLLLKHSKEDVIKDLCELINAKLLPEDIKKYIEDNKINKFTQAALFEKNYADYGIEYD